MSTDSGSSGREWLLGRCRLSPCTFLNMVHYIFDAVDDGQNGDLLFLFGFHLLSGKIVLHKNL